MISSNHKKIYRISWLLAGCVLATTVQADPARSLNTTFADYAQQQQQHDQQLSQNGSPLAKSNPSRTSVKPATRLSASTSVPSTQPSSTPLSSAGKATMPASVKSNSPVNINQADETMLSNTLTGVGPAKARAIVAYRREHGGFKTVDELVEVKGIGPATLEKNRHLIRIN